MNISAEADYLSAIDHFEARLSVGVEELIPASVVNAILDGGNPVRIWRGHRGLSGRALAQAAGISPSYLSQIETGKREGPLNVMKRLAEALNITLDDLAG